MATGSDRIAREREMLLSAESQGLGGKLGVYTKLSGPGWLQSAITLGGGSLSGALFLGVLGGTDMLWLQLVAIIMGVVMLSAISYVTLSTGKRPFSLINEHINPALGWAWLMATIAANIIWCMPQFSLCFEALEKNLIGFGNTDAYKEAVENGDKMYGYKITISVVFFVLASFLVYLNSQRGLAAKIFDWALKIMVGIVVISFFGVVVVLTVKGKLAWGAIFSGFFPDLTQWVNPAGAGAENISGFKDVAVAEFWSERVVGFQRTVMIGAAATAVGINMTFLLPYSMLARGWDKPFRGLAKFDLSTGMAIPYVLVTSCVVIAAAAMFNGEMDEKFGSTDIAVMKDSPLYKDGSGHLMARLEATDESVKDLSNEEKEALIAKLPKAEKEVAASLVKRNAFDLSQSLSPLLGGKMGNTVFGIGVLGMGFSSILILMLINGYAFCEMLGTKQGGMPHMVGCLVAGLMGACWWLFWDGDAKMWFTILAGSFGMMLLPIAYVTFMLMMNSRKILGDDKPQGRSLLCWNVLMGGSVLGAIAAALTAVAGKASDPVAGSVVMSVGVILITLILGGFLFEPRLRAKKSDEASLQAEIPESPTSSS